MIAIEQGLRIQTAEILRFPLLIDRAARALVTLASVGASASFRVTTTHDYRGGAEWLLLWGPGAPNRFEPMRAQLAAGGHVAALDLAYWNRQTKIRVSIDGAHPQAWVMRKSWPAERFISDRVRVADVWDPHGPVLIAGIGRKATVQYGSGKVLAWEEGMIAACRERWPDRAVLYRRKQGNAPMPLSVLETSGAIPIEDALVGCSLVVTWHSNVAVDAVRMGIPAICVDGAASAVCPDRLGLDDPRPLPAAIRDRFLANLAWFQWDPTLEAVGFWQFLREVIA